MKTIQTISKQHKNDLDHLDLDLLIAHSIKKDREFVIAHPEYKLTFLEFLRIKNNIAKRKKGIPLAYLVGYKFFYGYKFFVNRHTLIPRPDTELIIESVLSEIKSGDAMIDIGTGSGCIPITVKKECEKKNIDMDVFASDTSSRVLSVAQKNAAEHQVHIDFRHGSLLEPWQQYILNTKKNLFITANLPYLDLSWHTQEASIQFEPKQALIADDLGMALYKTLFKQISETKKSITLFIEIDPRHAQALSDFITKTYPRVQLSKRNDLTGKPRILRLKF